MASLHEIPSLSTMVSSINQVSLCGSLPYGGCASLTALARPTSAGVKRAHVALPVSPTRQGSSGHRRPHHAHGKVARVREETVPSPPRYQDDGDYTPSEDVGESTSRSESERLNSVLSLACFVLFAFGSPLGLGSWAFGLGSWGRGSLSFPRALS